MAKVNRKDSKGRVLKDGESERKDGRYCYRYIDEITGKRQIVYAKDLNELREKEKQIQKDIFDGIRTDSDVKNITLDELFKIHLNTAQIKNETKWSYYYHWNNTVSEKLQKTKIVDIKPIHIKAEYKLLADRNLAMTTILITNVLLYSTFELAEENNYIRFNPLKKVDPKKYGKDPKERKSLTIKQQNILLDYLKNDDKRKYRYPLLVFMLGTGLRAGEVCGLTKKDINFEKKEIYVKQQVVYKKGDDGYKVRVRDLKSKASYRTIPMSDSVEQALKSQIELNKIRVRNPNYAIGDFKNFIFCTRNGSPTTGGHIGAICRDILYNLNCKLLNENRTEDLIEDFSPHITRHTFCTRLAEQQIDIKVLQYLMGHSDVVTTMKIYNHINQDRIDNQYSILNSIIK